MQRTYWTRQLVALIAVPVLMASSIEGSELETVKKAEADRIKVIDKVQPAVVAVYSRGGGGGGSGVLIDPRGYALTNFHVVQPAGPIMQCGLADGVLYDAVIVGLDKVGDVALIRLLPKEEGKPFPYAEMGDSDKVRPGDWSLAMGNPFLLATDFTPTVTFGLVSGVNRYQYPEGKGLLEYTDCIQIDTSINPGNSGGPLFNMDGELIGINGRGSFDKRSRINSGVGYAISINQIKNFLGHLYAGLDTDHATLGVLVRTQSDEGDLERMVVTELLEDADAYRRGLDLDDELVSFAGRPVTSVNQYKNILGIYPKDWRVPLVYRRGNEKKEILVRLLGNMAQPVDQQQQQQPMPGGRPRPGTPQRPKVDPKSPAGKMYKPKKGFANYHFNELERDRLMEAFREHGDFSEFEGDWTIIGKYEMPGREGNLKLDILPPANDEDPSPTVKLQTNLGYTLRPLDQGQSLADLMEPLNSGGMMMALYHWQRFLLMGKDGFKTRFDHGGHYPFYPVPIDQDEKNVNYIEHRHDCEVIHTEFAAVKGKWYFSLEDQKLLGFEIWVSDDEDPCEVYLHDYKEIDGRQLPHTFVVRHGNNRYAVLRATDYTLKG